MFDIDHQQPYIIKLYDLLTSEECQSLIAKIDSLAPEVATINTLSGTAVYTDLMYRSGCRWSEKCRRTKGRFNFAPRRREGLRHYCPV